MLNKIVIIYTTISSIEQADKIAEQVIMNKLAACANIIPGALSVYMWEGALQRETEYLIILKTSISKADLLYKWLLDNHPYDIPAIVKITVDSSEQFNNYINGITTK